jgi:hypothetical protein
LGIFKDGAFTPTTPSLNRARRPRIGGRLRHVALLVFALVGCAVGQTRMFYCGQDGKAHCDHGLYASRMDVITVSCRYDDAAKRLEKSCATPE